MKEESEKNENHQSLIQLKDGNGLDFESEWNKYAASRGGGIVTINVKQLAEHFFELGIKKKEDRSSLSEEPVSIHYADDGKPDGIRVRNRDLDLDFVIALHDEPGGEYSYKEAMNYSLMDEKKARLYGILRKEINELMLEAGGDPLREWCWTSTPAAEVFGATHIDLRFVFNGKTGNFDCVNPTCLSVLYVRVVTDLTEKKS